MDEIRRCCLRHPPRLTPLTEEERERLRGSDEEERQAVQDLARLVYGKNVLLFVPRHDLNSLEET